MGVRSEAVRLLRFSAVGTLAFCVDLGVFNLLRTDDAGVGPLWAKVVSVVLATTVSWLGSRYWTFRDGRRARAGAEALAFFAVNGVGMLIALACLWVSHYALGLTSALADNVSGTFVGVALGNLFRYAAYRWLVFRPPSPRREVVVAAPPELSRAPQAAGSPVRPR